HTKVSPMVKQVCLDIPPPTIYDNISDLDRLKRSLEEKGLKEMRFSHRFVSGLSRILREANWKVVLGYTEDKEVLYITDSEKFRGRYGLAVDIGTTTVVLYLVDLIDGRLIDVGSTYNSQMRYGDDVITRIIHATEGGGLNELRDAIVSDINDLLRPILERHQINRDDIESIVIAGNTTMSHIFWGLDPAYIREEPYIPTANFFPRWKAGTARIEINPQATVYTLPCVASYVGGDIVAGVLASRMHRSSEIALFMDIGTNGEIAIGNNEWLMTAACSAGPCFEGSGIKNGMRATEGAIESVSINRETLEPEIKVIGNSKPIGICGSGMIDAISEMFLSGIIDQKGKLIDSKSRRVRTGEDGKEFLFYEGKDKDSVLSLSKEIVLTEVDIENILRAKAAIYAGVTLLLKEVGFGMDVIERVYIAGGFGNYLNVEKAIILGMLPDLPRERFTFLGNTSITGAYLCLLSEELRKEAEDIASKMTYVELSVSRGFMDEYISALFLPHTDISLFPSVSKMIDFSQQNQ
ncbi:MAG: ASKHA domain-containing protein, partial [Thermodesulfovibrionales bacterium]